MLNMFFEMTRRVQKEYNKAAEAVLDKVEEVVAHPETQHAMDLFDALAAKNLEYVDLIADYGSSLVERISTRNEPKND